ncbi:hypothetical protein [Sphingomonas sp. CGMCC 1.13658]|uniref:hypothetical protein n=1 Tax=Sphingomonas sp. CGMCC 1.13658 TaxID=2755554 RepID=UPI0012EE5FA4|nr:hypothetical protein [Sphingomonas sp. CGMCC 1.13658]MBA2920047.1 hypothetical protein [Sphingomonas sp. CGMCC 1.13658]
MRSIWSFRAREALVILIGIAMLAGFVFLLAAISKPPPGRPERVQGTIVGFWSTFRKATLSPNRLHVDVRMPDGGTISVAWPDDGRGRACKVGDAVRLVRWGSRLALYDPACPPGRESNWQRRQ